MVVWVSTIASWAAETVDIKKCISYKLYYEGISYFILIIELSIWLVLVNLACIAL